MIAFSIIELNYYDFTHNTIIAKISPFYNKLDGHVKLMFKLFFLFRKLQCTGANQLKPLGVKLLVKRL
jgi:hypothetical protein